MMTSSSSDDNDDDEEALVPPPVLQVDHVPPKLSKPDKYKDLDALFLEATTFVEALTHLPLCMSAQSRKKATPTNCQCLHDIFLTNPDIGERIDRAVAAFQLKKGENEWRVCL